MMTTDSGPTTAEGQASPSGTRRRTRRGDPFFVAGLVGVVALAGWCGRGLWFFLDDWKVITSYHDGHWLDPFNGHLSLVPVAVYRTLLSTVGYDYWPYRTFALVCYAAAVAAVFAFARERVGSAGAALAALLVAWSSQAQLMMLFPLLFNFTIPVAATVAIWLLLDRDQRVADVVASVLLAIALATSSVGLIAPMAVVAELGLRRERRVRRWLTFAPPIVLWAAWYVAFAHGHTGAGGTLGSVASFAGRQFWATFVGLAAGSDIGGVAVFVVTVLVVFAAVTRWRTFDRRAAAIAATLLGFLLISAVGRNAADKAFGVPAIPPETDRYMWVDGLLVICMVVQCLRGRRATPAVVAAMAVLIVANGAVLADHLLDYRSGVILSSRNVRTILVGVDALGERADQARELPLGFLRVPTPDYLDFARHYGSPVEGVSVDDLGDEEMRATVDQWMVEDLGIRLSNAVVSSCTPLRDASSTAGAMVQAPATVLLTAGDATTVRVRRLARGFGAPPLGEITSGATSVVRLPVDHSGLPWFVRVDSPDATAALCR